MVPPGIVPVFCLDSFVFLGFNAFRIRDRYYLSSIFVNFLFFLQRFVYFYLFCEDLLSTYVLFHSFIQSFCINLLLFLSCIVLYSLCPLYHDSPCKIYKRKLCFFPEFNYWIQVWSPLSFFVFYFVRLTSFNINTFSYFYWSLFVIFLVTLIFDQEVFWLF